MSEAQKQGGASKQRRGVVRAVRSAGAIALTGVNSYLGRSLVASLERDRRWRRIVAIDLKNTPTAGPKTRFYKVDLTQPAVDAQLAEILNAEKVDTIVHGAFLGTPTNATAWAHELESVGTMHVLGACEEHRVRKIIMRSHTILYGAHSNNPLYLSEEHPLRGDTNWSFVGDKIDAEHQVAGYAERNGTTIVTVLRAAPTVGPTTDNFLTQMLRRRVIPTVLGYDPLIQLIHELDVVAAYRIAINEDHPGVYNIVGHGVLPLTSVLRLAGRLELWIPGLLARPALGMLNATHLVRTAPALMDYLMHPCVACGEKAAEEMGFRASYSTREALGDFARVLRRLSGADGALVASSASLRRGV
jgi:UDP-glucose 4-epimerase